jgi:hypothetical protein
LYKKAISGDVRAMQFYLKTQAGWTETSHIELSKAEEPVDSHRTVTIAGADCVWKRRVELLVNGQFLKAV